MSGDYLGDGVFATFDGWHIVLTVERDGRDERVYLGPEVYQALVRYADGRGYVRPDAPEADGAR